VNSTRAAVAAGAAVLLFGAAAAAAFGGVGAATVGEPAVRDVAFTPGEVCDVTTVTALSARHPDVRQFVIMATDGFAAVSGTVEVMVRSTSGEWLCRRGATDAMFGRSGTRPLLQRRSGDGSTPAGVFPLGEATAWDGQKFSMFGNRPDPGVHVAYRAVRAEDCWGATPGTARYQHLVRRPGCSGPDELLRSFGEAYSHAAVIGANLDPISGDEPGEIPFAAAIFLHRTSYAASGASKPTSGCVSLGDDDLVDTLRAIEPDLNPHFAIGPRHWLRTDA
jgi:L,D-peptidoglycan transpeptidase YkuD (ErfK/YbiS/YcfS/YnhG family)